MQHQQKRGEDPETRTTPFFIGELKKAFESSIGRSRRLDGGAFFDYWFRSAGKACFFLFSRNLSRTNVQLAELIALVRLHTSHPELVADHGSDVQTVDQRWERAPVPQFLTLDDFLGGFIAIAESLRGNYRTRERYVAALIDYYADVLFSTIVVEVFFGSCTVFLPPHLRLDVGRVTAEAGYVHSAGRNLYTRSLQKAKGVQLRKSLRAYCHMHRGARARFVVYAHEDFVPSNKEEEAAIRGGIGDVRIFLEKYFLDNKPLASVVRDLVEELPQLELQEPRQAKSDVHKATTLDNRRTLWLIVDRGVSERVTEPADEQFLICYEQQFRNENAFHYVDENKPAWMAHTTIPHTLAGALINITRPHWPNDREVVLVDPFAGSGTVVLEALKFEGVRSMGQDIQAMSRLLFSDNLMILSMRSDDLQSLLDVLLEVSKQQLPLGRQRRRKPGQGVSPAELCQRALDQFERLGLDEDPERELSVRDLRPLKRSSLTERVFFYLAMRARVRHAVSLDRGRETWDVAYMAELCTLSVQLSELLASRKRQSLGGDDWQGGCLRYRGLFSDALAVSAETLQARGLKAEVVKRDILDGVCAPADVIVCDPPYGFNTELDKAKLAELYSRALDRMLTALEGGGEIVICLPDKSRSGREIPAFVLSGWVTQQLLAKAGKHGLEPVIDASVLPRPGSLFRPPYYWQSERALRRSILHFRLVPKRAE